MLERFVRYRNRTCSFLRPCVSCLELRPLTADICAFHVAKPNSNEIFKSISISYRTIILPVVLYGCETCSLTVREERMLRMFESGVLRRVFGAERDEVTVE